MTTTLRETNSGYRQGTRAVVPEGSGQKIRVRLMGWEPGATVVEGSSADYPVPVIARDFAETFPIGTRMRANHDGFCEAGGDVRRIMAKTISTPEQEADGMYADAIVKEGEPSEFIRQFADVIGTSISAGAEVEMEAARDEDGEIIMDGDKPVMVPKRSERGAQIVKRFLTMGESPYNAVDFVEAPGADGAIVKVALESAKVLVEHMTIREAATFAIGLAGDPREKAEAKKLLANETSEAAPSRNTEKENEMSPEEAQTLAEKTAEEAVRKYVESQAPSAPEQPSLSDIAEAVVTAGLSKEGRQAVYARVESGASIADAVTAEKSREDAIRAEVQKEIEAKQAESSFGFGFTSDDKSGSSLPGLSEKDSRNSEAFDEEFERSFATEEA